MEQITKARDLIDMAIGDLNEAHKKADNVAGIVIVDIIAKLRDARTYVYMLDAAMQDAAPTKGKSK